MATISKEAILLPTKLNRPRLVDDLVRRPRLLKKLDSARRSKLLLVSAPAGFGKSTLVAWWLAELPDVASAWISLDEHDNSLASFVAYFTAAVELRFPGACARLRGMSEAMATPQPALQALALADELGDLPAELVVVLDDFHTIKAPEILELVENLLLHQPEQLHLVILTRQDPPLPLARLRVQQELVDIRASELRFRRAETTEFFRLAVGDALSPDTVALLEQRAEGWIAGLRIAAISLQDADEPNVAARSLAGMQRHVMDFLMEQVLAQQPPALRDFLLRTSILERLSAPLCDALVANRESIRDGNGPAAISAGAALRMLETSNLFLVPLDDERLWFRYHNLFRDLLRHRLQVEADDGTIAELYRRAASWLEATGHFEEALYAHLAAGKSAAAAEMVERHVAHLLDIESNQVLQHWLSQLPAPVVAQRPILLVAKAWIHSIHSELAAIPPLLQQAVALHAHDESTVPDALALRLRSDIDALWCNHWFWHGQAERAIAHARDAIDCLPEGDTLPRGYASNILAFALSMSGRRQEALEFLRDQMAKETSQSGTRIRMLFGLAVIQFSAGSYYQTNNAAQELLRLASAQNRANTQGWSHYLLGRVYLTWNESTLAQQHFLSAVSMRYLVNAKMYHDSLHGLALAQAAQGAIDEAGDSLATAMAFAVENLHPGDAEATRSIQAWLALQQGVPASKVHMDRPAVAAGPSFWLDDQPLVYAMWLRARGSAEDTAAADVLLRDLCAIADRAQDDGRLVEVLVEQVVLYAKTERSDMALVALRRAVLTAQASGVIWPFAKAGKCLMGPLRRLADADVAPQFIRRLQDVIAVPQEQPERKRPLLLQQGEELVELLTERELEVLKLLADRLSDKEIAQALVISPLTVRKHTSNIFDKLQVHSRRQAVSRATSLGLLPPR